MKPSIAVIVFFSLLLSSLFLSYDRYAIAKEHIIEDVNQALARTIRYEAPIHVTADTLEVYRSNLKIGMLRKTSYMAMCSDEPSNVPFCSDTLSYKYGGETFHFRAYPNCSEAAVFSMSGQTVPGMLLVASLLWGLFSMLYFRRNKSLCTVLVADSKSIVYGNLSFSASRSLFYNENYEEIHFTPLQFAFMKILITNEDKRVPVHKICESLWPGKYNARETLYTLVRRLKPVVEGNSNIKIISEKGGYYSLRIED